MQIFELSHDHWYKDIQRSWLLLVRVACTCGWRTRPYLRLDSASNALINHQASQGRRIA